MTVAIEAERGQVRSGRDNGISPLYGHMTETVPRLFVDAVRAQARYEIADQKVRAHGSTLTGHLDKVSDQLADEVQQLLERARDRKDSRTYVATTDLAAEWTRASALYEWSLDTTRPFRRRRPNSVPAQLGYLEWEAATATGGTSTLVPIEALSFPDAPTPSDRGRPR